jgi:hypothetical protein
MYNLDVVRVVFPYVSVHVITNIGDVALRLVYDVGWSRVTQLRSA